MGIFLSSTFLNLNRLVEKFRTPMGRKSNGPVFNKKADIIDLISEEEQNVKQTKKRSALMAEISVL